MPARPPRPAYHHRRDTEDIPTGADQQQVTEPSLRANGVSPQPDEPYRGRLPSPGQAHAGTRGQSD